MNILARLWRSVRSDVQEKTLLGVAVIAGAFLVLAEARFVVWEITPEWLVAPLTHNALKSIVSSISSSVVAAYVFYIFVELLPRLKKRAETLRYLDMLLFLVFNEFHNKSRIGLTLPLFASASIAEHSSLGLTLEFVTTLESELHRQGGSPHLGEGLNPYELLAEAADSRLVILDIATQMANELSFQHGLIWSDIIDKLHQISLKSANTLVPMTNNERRNIMLMKAMPLLKKWLELR